jgi:hypothetical protein
MASLPRLPRKLRDVLGPDAAEDLVTILDQMRAEHAELRRQLHDDFVEHRREIRSDFKELVDRLDGRFDRVDTRFAALESKVGDVKSDLMKWSFVFWCGAVAAVAALAGVLRP